MANYTGPKVKLSRKLGVPISDTPKHQDSRRLEVPPGGWSGRRRRLSDFGIRLREKQKLCYYYNVMEKQFKRYVHIATKRKGNTGKNLLELLERRLDNAVRRAGMGRTIWQARQMVVHGHFLVNGRRVNKPGYLLRVGDVVTVKEKSQKWMQDNVTLNGDVNIPNWVEFDKEKCVAKLTGMPEDPVMPFQVDLGLIIEYYH